MKLKLIKLNSVSSTNNIAIKLIRQKKFNPSIITAKKQRRGRGTRGKKWFSKKNNLFISIYFELNSKNLRIDQFALFNPHIIKSVLSKYTKKKIDIKRPNDLLINKDKISGILQEIIDCNDKKYLIIGIGINTLSYPKDQDFKSTSIAKWSNMTIKNDKILSDIKIAYEKFLSDINKYKFTYLKKKFCKG